MSELARRTLGRTGLTVSEVCIGTSPLSMADLYGYDVSESRAVAAVRAVLDGPITFLDTSNEYGGGESERLVGLAIRAHGGLPDGFVLATKVDPDPRTGDFSRERVHASLSESLDRLGVDRVPLLHLHDPERIGFAAAMAPHGPVEALAALRDEGRVDAIGVAGGPVALMRELIDSEVFDVLLTHNRFTLLDRSADSLLDRATQLGMGVINAAPYGGGILSKGPDERPQYAYGLGDESVVERARAMAEVCRRHGVPLAAAALQFSLRDIRIHSTVVGASAPERVRETIALATKGIHASVWEELAELAPEEGVWLG